MPTTVGADLARVAERLRRSTVEVHGPGGGIGAGVVWSDDGLIVTNAHVARGPVRVIDADGRVFVGRLVGWDPERDLAALVLDGLGATAGRRRDGSRTAARPDAATQPTPVPPAAPKGDPDALRVGDLVVALGHPGGVVGAVTVGVVHAIVARGAPPRRRLLQADLRLAPGNSGGPMADARGRVVGVNAMISGGLAVAITTSTIATFLGDLRQRTPAGAGRDGGGAHGDRGPRGERVPT